MGCLVEIHEDDHEVDDSNHHQLQITYSLDGEYLRRTCSSCGRDFKTQAEPGSIVNELAPYFRKIGAEYDIEIPDSDKKDFLYCPYCSHCDRSSEMLTEETLEHAKRIVMREVFLPMMEARLGEMVGEFNRTCSGGILGLSMNLQMPNKIIRPLSGPEPPDLSVVIFLCCKKNGKVNPKFAKFCAYCGTTVAIH